MSTMTIRDGLAALAVAAFSLAAVARPATADDPARKLVIPFDFQSRFDQGRYGRTVGDLIWARLKREGLYILPESMQEVRDWCERRKFAPGPDTPLATMREAVRDGQAGDVGVWGRIERVEGFETDVYDLSIKVADFTVDPPRILFETTARTKTVSEVPQVHVKAALDALAGRSPTSTASKAAPPRPALGPSLVRGDFEKGRDAPIGWDPLGPHVVWDAEGADPPRNRVIRFDIPKDVAESTGVLYYSLEFPIEAGATYRFRCRWKSTAPAAKVFIKGYDEVAGPSGTARREVYRSQQNLQGPLNTWNDHAEEFTPKHSRFTPRWARVMLYAYHPAGSVAWDGVAVEPIQKRGHSTFP